MKELITEKDIIEKGGIYFSKIEEGFDSYQVTHIQGEDAIHRFLEEQMNKNGFEHSFVDFYYGRLDMESKYKVKSILSEEEIAYINTLPYHETIYFPLDPILFQIVYRLSISDMLFSTFYFTDYPMTIWSNYNQNWPVFTRKENYV